MKTRLILLLLLFSSFPLCSDDYGDRIIIAMNAWEPLKSETEPYGVLARITREAFALEGVEVEFRVAPWKRGYDYAKAGVWHGIVGWNSTEERQRIFYVSSPVLLEDVVFFHHKDLPVDWESLEDLEGYTVGLIKGYNYGPHMAEAVKEGLLSAEATDSEEQSIKMLQKKRFELWPCEVDVGLYLIETFLSPSEAGQLSYNPRPVQVSDLCLLLSREIGENREYLERFERGLQTLKDSGRYNEIIEEFLPGFFNR